MGSNWIRWSICGCCVCIFVRWKSKRFAISLWIDFNGCSILLRWFSITWIGKDEMLLFDFIYNSMRFSFLLHRVKSFARRAPKVYLSQSFWQGQWFHSFGSYTVCFYVFYLNDVFNKNSQILSLSLSLQELWHVKTSSSYKMESSFWWVSCNCHYLPSIRQKQPDWRGIALH